MHYLAVRLDDIASQHEHGEKKRVTVALLRLEGRVPAIAVLGVSRAVEAILCVVIAIVPVRAIEAVTTTIL